MKNMGMSMGRIRNKTKSNPIIGILCEGESEKQYFTMLKQKYRLANIKVKMKNLRTGSTTEMTFGGNDKVKRAQIDKKEMQYLYNTGDAFVFMDGETYEQIEIPAENLEWEKNFLKESDTATIRSFEGEVLGVQLPDKVTLQITEAEQAVKGDTATGATKNAVLETGFQIKVPLFINEGEMVVISTAEGKYSGRA